MKPRTRSTSGGNRGQRQRQLAALLLASSVAVGSNAAIAGQPAAVERLGRLFGFGWSDGYHVCRDGECRPTADLPPKSYPDHLARSCRADGCGPVYPPATALPRSSNALVDPAACNAAACDQRRVWSGNEPPPAATPHPVELPPAEPRAAVQETNRPQPQETTAAPAQISGGEQAIPQEWIEGHRERPSERPSQPADAGWTAAPSATESPLTLQPESAADDPQAANDSLSTDDLLLSPSGLTPQRQPPTRRLPVPTPDDRSRETNRSKPVEMPIRIPPPQSPASPQPTSPQPTSPQPTAPQTTPSLPAAPTGESLLHQPPRTQVNPFLRPAASGDGSAPRIAALPVSPAGDGLPQRQPAGDGQTVRPQTVPPQTVRPQTARPQTARPQQPSTTNWNPVRQP